MEYIDSFIETFNDWPSGTITCILLAIVFLLILGLIIWGLFIAVDSWFVSKIDGTGKIIQKSFTPAYVQLLPLYDPATKVNTLQTIYHPDDYSVLIDVDGMQGSISIKKSFYDHLSINDMVTIKYIYGRISKDLYIKNIYS